MSGKCAFLRLQRLFIKCNAQSMAAAREEPDDIDDSIEIAIDSQKTVKRQKNKTNIHLKYVSLSDVHFSLF